MMSALRSLALLLGLVVATALPAHAGERDRLNECQAMVERVARTQQSGTAHDETELQKCRQMIKEWTLRDSRMSVDEQGRPLR
jgi:hypothetical protein